METPNVSVEYENMKYEKWLFSTNLTLSRKLYKIGPYVIVTMEHRLQLVCNLSNAAVSVIHISRSRHYLTLNISETIEDSDI